MYKLIKPLLFKLDPELAHRLSLKIWDYWSAVFHTSLETFHTQPVEIFGLQFPNPVGLAAGVDKDGEHIASLFQMGIGFIEVGGVTPKPQPGNPKPRLRRLPEYEALINRMGFNNKGVANLVDNLVKVKKASAGIVGVNLAKNKVTPLARAADDYCQCLEAVYPHVDFATVNISSPNTPGLRELQGNQYLSDLLAKVVKTRDELAEKHQHRLPLCVKISVDLKDEEIEPILSEIMKNSIDGVIVSNTSVDHSAVANHPCATEPGGLSGKPLFSRSVALVHRIHQYCGERLPIIAVGGISSKDDVQTMLSAGASLVQIYTALVYQGPWWLRRMIRSLNN